MEIQHLTRNQSFRGISSSNPIKKSSKKPTASVDSIRNLFGIHGIIFLPETYFSLSGLENYKMMVLSPTIMKLVILSKETRSGLRAFGAMRDYSLVIVSWVTT
jgi:hypothetical protein